MRYAKFLVAAVGATATAAQSILTPDTKWWNVATAVLALLTALGVRQIPNQPAGEHRVAREDVRSAVTDELGDHGHVRPTRPLRQPRDDGP